MAVVRICCSSDNISDGWEVRPSNKTQTQRIPMTSFANECVSTIFCKFILCPINLLKYLCMFPN